MSTSLRDKIYKWNSLDVKVYDRFNKTLWRKIKEYGEDFEKDLQEFRRLRDAVSRDCGDENSSRLVTSTVELLEKSGSVITDPVKFCINLEAWFSQNVPHIAKSSYGPGSCAIVPVSQGMVQPLTYRETTPKIGERSQCLRINYLKKNSSDVLLVGLEVYFSVNSTHKTLPSEEMKTIRKGYFTANYQLTDVSNVQVMCEAKRVSSDYVIDSVQLSGGNC
ncbi:uncharacterized protein LOC144440565 [Glandiceps talaboti]